MTQSPKKTSEDRKIKRPIVSDLDGTQQGGLAFCVSLIGGIVAAASIAPGSLTSFWVCVAIVAMAAAIASGTQKAFARSSEERAE